MQQIATTGKKHFTSGKVCMKSGKIIIFEKMTTSLATILFIATIIITVLLQVKISTAYNAWYRKNNFHTDFWWELVYTPFLLFRWKAVSIFLKDYFPYYKTLSSSDKNKFVKRCIVFAAHHSFRFHKSSLNNKRAKRYLISASAIQLTFGLNGYLMSYFNEIVVIENSYQYDDNKYTVDGHVNLGGSIFLSWQNVLYGVKHSYDNDNVALHEMAHALHLQCFNTEYGGDHHFTENYHQFTRVAKPLLTQYRSRSDCFLGEYALTNMQEFWAKSVETFFEQPKTLFTNCPELYTVIKIVLKQDTLQNFQPQ